MCQLDVSMFIIESSCRTSERGNRSGNPPVDRHRETMREGFIVRERV